MERYVFLCGAEMDPSAARAAYPEGRFVARARTEAAAGEAGETWGILLRVPAPGGEGDERGVVTDGGRRFRAVAPAGWRPAGEPAAVLAAARYWELPPAYVRRLAEPGRDQG